MRVMLIVLLLTSTLLKYCHQTVSENSPKPSKPLKILIASPRVGYSHVILLGKIADILTEQGHDVHVLSIGFMADVQTSGTSLAKVKRIEFGMEEEISSVMVKVHSKIWDDFGPSDYLRLVTLMSSSFVKFCEEILTSQELKQWMSEHEFDVIISEMLFCFHGCPKTTHITISATNPMEWMTEAFMIPNAPALVPGNSSPLTPKMNMIQKVMNVLDNVLQKLVIRYLLLRPIDELGKKHSGQNYVPLETFLGDSSYLMVNSHEIIDFPRPITSQWIYIGGLRPPEPKGLDEWWSNTLSMRNYSSIVIVSFGSIAKASEMPSHVKQAYIDAMSALNDTLFIWKYEKPAHGFASELDNVVTKEWLPQVDLLHDPRITALITHAGISSIFEAVRAAKPLITVPLFADQMRNSEMLRYRGVSVALPKQATYHQIVNAVQKIHEKKYSKNMEQLSAALRDAPFSSEEKIVKYVEFAAKHDVKKFIAPHRISTIQYFFLDIIAMVSAFIVGISVVIAFLVKKRVSKKTKAKVN